MTRVAGILAAMLFAAACRGEALGTRTSYVFKDPRLTKLEQVIVFPGALGMEEMTRLLTKARGEGFNGELALYETDAGIEEVASYYASAYGEASSEGDAPAPVVLENGAGDFASDEAALAPLFATLGLELSRGRITGHYRTIVVQPSGSNPTISLQRPYRDLVRDEIVDRTLIMIEERR